MKHLLFIVCIVLGMVACKQEPAYTIRGTVELPGFEGGKVYLTVGDRVAEHPQMDTAVVTGGKYTFKGTVAKPECAWLLLQNPGNPQETEYIGFALENADIAIHTDAGNWTTVSGTEYNEEYQRFKEARRPAEQALDSLREEIRKITATQGMTPEMQEDFDALWSKWAQERAVVSYDSIKCHINNPAFWNDVYICAASQPLEKQKELIAGANARTRQAPELKKVIELIEVLERTAVGQPFIDLQMFDLEGNEVALSDYVGKGKYLLVDFWASWCVPCREEMPYLKALYEKYKSQGLDIVGISVDNNHKAWAKAINDLNLPWHHISDLKGGGSDVLARYGINGIPHLMLLDRDGIIIARGLRGEGLQEKLAELMD